MRTLLATLCWVCVALAAQSTGAETFWAADGTGISQVTSNKSTRMVAIDDVQALAATADGSLWAMSGRRVVHIAGSGTLDADIDLGETGYGDGIVLAIDAYDGTAWIGTGTRLLLHFSKDGSLLHGTSLPGLADALALALDQSPWLLIDGDLVHFSRNAEFLTPGTGPLPNNGRVKGIALDSLRGLAWINDSTGVWRVRLDGAAPPEAIDAVSKPPRALAVDVYSGDLWVVVDGALIAIGADGAQKLAVELPVLAGRGAVVLDYDAATRSLQLQTAGMLLRIAADGTLLQASKLPDGWRVGSPAPFRVEPTLALIRPPSGSATYDTSPDLTFRLTASCNGTACDAPTDYLGATQVLAKINGVDATNRFIDGRSDSVAVSPRVPLTVGANRLTARAVDPFGHEAAIAATITVLERDPEPVLPGEPKPRHAPTDASSSILKAPNKPPSVTWTAPSNGSVHAAGATLSLAATAIDTDGTVIKVEFYRGGSTLIGTATTAPHRVSWANVPAGSYTLTAKAYDNKSATASSSPITISVIDNQLPVINLTSPADSAFYAMGTAIPIAATAADPDGTISKIEFFDASVSIGTVSGAPFAISWTSASPGSHVITAHATDDKGGTAVSSSIDIVVGQPPIVVVKTPLACSSVEGPADLILMADALSTTGTIARVEFFDDGTLVGVSSAAPWLVTLTGAALGNHSITARAVDEHGLATTSRPALMSVQSANQLPAVSVTSPLDGARYPLGSLVALAASASDSDGAVTAVEYRIGSAGGALIGRATVAPYAVSWANMSPGSYTLVAVAFDDRNATRTSIPIHVTIEANRPPTVAISAPAMNASYTAPASIAVGASAVDSDGSIAKVEFYAGTVLIGSATSSPYTATWSSVGAGTYLLTAKATDDRGAVTTSSPIAVTVVSNVPPVVSLITPASGARFFAPATIAITANAADNDGSIARVDFYANGALIGSSFAAPYAFVWDGVAGGAYSISVRATDNAGSTTVSPAAGITVDAGPDLGIASALEGATIDDDNVLVQGYVFAPPNSALTVNGVVTHIDDYGHFQANDVPLSLGANTVTAVITTQDGQTNSRSVTVNSAGRGPFVVHASPTEGIETLQVTFTMQNVDGVIFKQVNFDFDNDGSPNLVASSSQFVDGTLTVTATYPAGTWLATIKVFDDQDRVVYATSKSIVVLLPAALDAKLRGIFDGTLGRLRAGNITGALSAFTGSAYDKYNAIFTRLQPAMASIIDQLGQVREVNFSMDFAELHVVRNTSEGAKRFMVYLIRAEDGIWRIDGM